MLQSLNINSIALIESLGIEFEDGLNVLTGETGAGKSIVVDAVNLVLGERADRELIRSGQEKARVEATFDIAHNAEAKNLLSEWGVDAQDGMLVLMRELSVTGRNICRANGQAISLSQLKLLTSQMVDLHGQHEHQSLLDESRHIAFLDAFGGQALQDALNDVARRYAGYREICGRLHELAGDPMERQKRILALGQQTKEIRNAAIRPGEAEELEQKREVVRNAARIQTALDEAYSLLGGGDREGAVSLARSANKRLKNIEHMHPDYQKLNDALDQAIYPLEEILLEIRALRDTDEMDPQAIERLEDRLTAIRSMMRRFGGTEEAVLEHLAQADAEYERLIAADGTIAALQKEKALARFHLQECSQALSELRKTYAKTFEREVLGHLADLGMKNAQFEVAVDVPIKMSEAEERFSPRGFDKVAFMMSANRGETLKPLARVASGGELSRVMLALKSVAAELEGVDTMIFDEIDTGISGRMAQVVAEKMVALAGRRQVVCVTHLPQIASMADTHFLVDKSVEGARTLTTVRRLDDGGRAEEIARITGGAEKPALALKHATGMLEAARRRRTEIAKGV